MSTVLDERPLARAPLQGWQPWVAVLLGLALLYVPTYLDLSRGLWREDAYAHGPIVVGVFAWLLWRRREVLLDASLAPAPIAGGALLFLGLLLYLLGRTQGIALFEVSSHLPVIAGAVLMLRGAGALRRLAFPFVFLLFLVPLPGFVLDVVTTPLKSLVSASVEWLLALLAYPVERSGVVLRVGDHEMLVADACSGLNSLYSLFALGLLYTHLTKPGTDPGRTRDGPGTGLGRTALLRGALLIMAIVPIAVAANILRVLALVLVTYHFGEEAAQGALHDFAGMMVFIAAFALLIAFDGLLRRILPAAPVDRTAPAATHPAAERTPADSPAPARRAPILALAIAAMLAMGATAAAAPALKPQPAAGADFDLEQAIPARFGDWQIDPNMVPLAPTPDVQANLDRLYRQVLSRTYVNSSGEQMMLTIAHGGDQSDALKAHRQEACYAAQGFEIRALAHGSLSTAGRTIPVTRMLAVRGERVEPVTYWFTMGDRVVLGRLERLQVQLRHGLSGRIPDGLLVRVSSLSTDAPGALASQQSFIAAITAAMPAHHRARLLGEATP
jgi:exosortase B